MPTARIHTLSGASPPSRRRRPRRLLGAAWLAAAALSAPLAAHDFWIEPSSYRAAVGEPVALALRVGEKFLGEPVPADPRRTESFRAVGAHGAIEVAGPAGAEPAGRFPAATPGAHWIVYDSSPARLELAAEKFEQYLAEEGLERVLEQRRARGESARPGRELYSRCAKSLLRIGVGGPEPPAEVGLELELVVERRAPAAGVVELRLLFRGAPLAGAKIAALSRDRPELSVAARTDAAGRTRLAVPHAGVWLLKSVHMVLALAARHAEADWESFWASLTLELP